MGRIVIIPRNHKFFAIICLFAPWLLIISSQHIAYAEPFIYEGITGPLIRPPVCELFLKNLNSLEYRAAECDRIIRPEYGALSRLQWENVDLKENVQFGGRLYKFFIFGDQDYRISDGDWLPTYIYDIDHDLLSAKRATVDVDNDGKSETVILFSIGKCAYSSYYKKSLAIVDNADRIDYWETFPLLQNQSDENLVSIRGLALNGLRRMYDIFSYKGEYFFEKYNAEKSNLVIYRIKDGNPEIVCAYKRSH